MNGSYEDQEVKQFSSAEATYNRGGTDSLLTASTFLARMHRQPKLQLRDDHLAQQKEKPFSYVRRKPRNGQIAKMGSFHQSKRSNNK